MFQLQNERPNFNRLDATSHPSEIAQLVEAKASETTEKRESPIMVTEGAMVSGVTYLRTRPTMPK